MDFIGLVVDYVTQNGGIHLRDLYKPPFTDRGFIDNFFAGEKIDELGVIFVTLRARAVPTVLAA